MFQSVESQGISILDGTVAVGYARLWVYTASLTWCYEQWRSYCCWLQYTWASVKQQSFTN